MEKKLRWQSSKLSRMLYNFFVRNLQKIINNLECLSHASLALYFAGKAGAYHSEVPFQVLHSRVG